MKLISKVTEIYCIADDFCKEYELELNKKALSLSNPSPNTPKRRNRQGRMSDRTFKIEVQHIIRFFIGSNP